MLMENKIAQQPAPVREKKYYSEAEVCELFGVSKRTVARWRETGQIGYLRTPGSQTIRYTAQHLADFEKRHDHKAKGRRPHE